MTRQEGEQAAAALQRALAAALKLHACVKAPTVAAAVVDLLALGFGEHTSLVKFLLLPTALSMPGPSADSATVRPSPARMPQQQSRCTRDR